MFFVVMGKLQRVDENGDELDMGERRDWRVLSGRQCGNVPECLCENVVCHVMFLYFLCPWG